MRSKFSTLYGFRGRFSFRGVLKALLVGLRLVVFYVLLWMRVPVTLVLQGVTSLAAIAFFIMLVLRGWSSAFEFLAHACTIAWGIYAEVVL
ncbi:hypothetical protein LJR129_005165 [Acidovorax sp. LjRoot129]|uniref:hypothetical protein n=1 Tax=Acidovorax sp. LjRoot129 TaxID=3342260 RepID=UPI003ECE2A88